MAMIAMTTSNSISVNAAAQVRALWECRTAITSIWLCRKNSVTKRYDWL